MLVHVLFNASFCGGSQQGLSDPGVGPAGFGAYRQIAPRTLSFFKLIHEPICEDRHNPLLIPFANNIYAAAAEINLLPF